MKDATTSHTITFTFTAENNTTNANFDCSIDGEEFVPCNSSTITYVTVRNRSIITLEYLLTYRKLK